MQLASDTMYQAGSKTLLDLVLQQNSGHNVYQVRNMATADNILSIFSHTWAPSHSPSQAGRGSTSHRQWRNSGRPCRTPPPSALSAAETPPETDVVAPGFITS